MKYRPSFFLVLLAATSAGCFGEFEGNDYSDSEIVFGINQSTDADGKVTTSAGYEHLDVRDHGWSSRGLVSRESSCWSERLDDRLGQPRVEGGVAKFEGALLPAGGIAVVANRVDDLKIDGPAWKNAGDAVVFEAKGFAMPDIRPSKLTLPSTGLTIVAPADAAAEVGVRLDTNLEVAWEKGDPAGTRENVVVSLVAAPESKPEARGAELRCFFDRSAGTGKFPKNMMERFAALVGLTSDAPIKGKLRIATHRQLTIFANGGWTVYVVATADQREQPFTLQR